MRGLRGGMRNLIRNLAAVDSSEDIGDDDDVWEPLEHDDWTHLGITVGYQVLVLVAVLHLWWCRTWPPYVPRQVNLVCLTGIGGVLAYAGTLIASGAVDRHDGDFIAQCYTVAFFDSYGIGVWISVALIRVYRSWNVLVRHSVDMWPAWRQVLLLSAPWLTPTIVYLIDPNLSTYNERSNNCSRYVPMDTALFIYGCVPILGAFCLSFQMRKVRKQMNFYKMQVAQLLFLLITGTVVLPLQDVWLDKHHKIRRIWVMYHNVIASLILFWPPVFEPMYRFFKQDDEYLQSYTKGFSTLPTPAQLRSSFKDQLSLEQLRREFEKFADAKVARELPDFYKACLEREEIEDFFARQAATTAIIDRFVRSGSEQEVNLSGRVRDKILVTEVTSYNIFNEAMQEVVHIMESNFSTAFQKTDGYKRLEQKVNNEAEELERLRKMKQLPARDHVENERMLLRRVRSALRGRARLADNSSSESRVSDERTHSTRFQSTVDGLSVDGGALEAFDFSSNNGRRSPTSGGVRLSGRRTPPSQTAYAWPALSEDL